jgi:hypothetical protein
LPLLCPSITPSPGGGEEKEKSGWCGTKVGEELLEPIFFAAAAAAVLLPLPGLGFYNPLGSLLAYYLFIYLSILWAQQQKLMGMGLGFSKIFCS